MRLILKIIVLSCCLLSAGAFSQTSLPERIYLPLDRNAHARTLDLHMAPIKSRVALDTYMKMTSKKENPVMLLSPEARARFIESLSFNENGITGFRVDDLERELTPSKIYRILALFGSQKNVRGLKGAKIVTSEDEKLMSATSCYDPVAGGDFCHNEGDYQSYWCISRATCESKASYICTKNC